MGKLEGKTAIVTGAGAGIGRGIAAEFAKEGASVVIATLVEEEGEAAAKALTEAGGAAAAIRTDVRSEDDVRAMVRFAVDRFGKLDILVNNAGVTVFKPLREATADDWAFVQDVDLRSVFLCSKYAAERMAPQRSGAIVNIASVHASVTYPNTEMYAAAKAGVLGLTRSLALSLGADGIRVNAISPGFVSNRPDFDEWAAAPSRGSTRRQNILDSQALKRIITPADVGRTAVFLASDDAAMMTGAELKLDAGASLRLYNA